MVILHNNMYLHCIYIYLYIKDGQQGETIVNYTPIHQ